MMGLALAAFAVAVTAWWLATGAVIVAARRPAPDPLYMLIPASALGVAGVAIALATASDLSVASVYGAFFGALMVWAFHEISFLTGHLTGPRKTALPAGTSGGHRFRLAWAAVRDHELALFLTGAMLAVVLWGAANPFGWMVFALMWIMRLLTKLNVFLGAPNAVSEILPARMAYLTSYFRTDRVHAFFIVSVVIVTGLMTASGYMAIVADDPAAITGWSLMAAFAFLGLVEHLFLVLPVRDAALWGWATGSTGSGFIRRGQGVAKQLQSSQEDGRVAKRAAPVTG
ncbi:MAG: putative photosynthetic complex assembly protein PuhE [Phyllobacteriaceae bacterium]|nr:putative photosynthetic complex assembly protein PuhE [Phyllobacteriaceae bacterium]